MTAKDIRNLNERAVRVCVDVVRAATVGDLGRATPCADWTLGDLLAHMTVQHYGFAAAASGVRTDLAAWAPRPLADDPASAYAEAAERALTAFAEDGVLERAFYLPEISTELTFPGSQAIGFHFIDAVVHGWDVARSLGVPYALDPELEPAALRIALAVPDGERRLKPGAAFRPGLVSPEGATALDQILFALGRSPTWPG
jgi:uncharacterized protein (TIGR03086 family)